jgi:hypothetical protein
MESKHGVIWAECLNKAKSEYAKKKIADSKKLDY